MSIETVEKYLQELEAIKNYPQVIRDKDRLSQEVEKLKVKLERLNASLDNALKEVSSLKSSKAKLDGAEMTLEEARLDFIRAHDAEIERRATDKFDKLEGDYESKMPQLVYQRLRDILGQSRRPEEIQKLIDAEAKKKADVILQHQKSWPPWFQKLYEEEVRKKVSAELNEEFNTKVEAAALPRAQQKLEELAKREWPGWYFTNVQPKILTLESKINAGAIQLLKGPWRFTCDRCSMKAEDELSAGEIEQLLKTGQIEVACGNPNCEDSSWFSTRRHTLLFLCIS